jgi:hypothetical protein
MMDKCETCKFRDNDGRCTNEKLAESWSQSIEEKQDMLIYDYSEGGGFWVGPKFGCVHHKIA